ncbi:hypothetical protein [Micromonospora aurantiaca (nom. illeg.)]|uniref:hypothetical protein n=1 Tax=Micromonospora aurantiaca (nom. illeg.) TaxID=47850 RepID=UPI003414EFE7
MAVSYVGATSDTSVTTATTFPTSFPAGWAAGDVAILAGHISAANLTMSPGAGWSAVPGISNPVDQGANSRAYVWYRVLQSGDSAPTITGSGAITGGWEMVVLRDTAASPFGQVGTNSTAAGTSVALPSLTGVAAGSALVGIAHARVATGTLPNGINWDAAYTEVTDVSTSRATSAANLRNASAYRLIASAGTYGGESVAVNNSISSSMIAALIEVLQGSVPGTATASADGSLSAAAAVAQPATAGLAATGTLTASAAVLVPAGASLSATSAISAAAVIRQPGSANLTAAGTLSATAAVRATGAASLAGAATLTGVGRAVRPAGGAAAASGTLTATGTVRHTAVAALAAAATLDADPSGIRNGTAALAASTGLAATALVRVPAQASAAAAGTLTAAAAVRVPATVVLAAASTLTAYTPGAQVRGSSRPSVSGPTSTTSVTGFPGRAAVTPYGRSAATVTATRDSTPEVTDG